MNWKDLVDDVDFKEGFVAGAILTAVLLIGFWLWAEQSEVQLLNAMTAFGTVGAVLVALGFGLREMLLARQERTIEDSMLTALVQQECFDLLRRCEGMRWMLSCPPEKALGGLSEMLVFENIRTYASRPALVSTNKLFIRLKSLGLRRATAIARVIGNWNLLRDAIDRTVAENEDWKSEDLVQGGVKDALQQIENIKADLQIALAITDQGLLDILSPLIEVAMEESERSKRIKARLAIRAQQEVREGRAYFVNSEQ